MLASAKLVGFVLTTDYDRARAFYEGKLGFEVVEAGPYALVVKAGPSTIRIVRVPAFAPARSTVLGWDVEDIAATAAWLSGRGVALEKYPFIQDPELGIWTSPSGSRVAWFQDPDGNVLSISQHT
jgi:catechol 2,3-dioxygenase-like lactoylglutathione lyase family enzyme